MSVEFVDTNVLIYAHDRGAARKFESAIDLIARLVLRSSGALSIQVLAEFYSTAIKKLAMTSIQAEAVVADFAVWKIHRPGHGDLLRAAALQRRHKIAWWDAMILNSAIELSSEFLWSEDLSHGQRYDSVTVLNPFR